MRYCYVAIIGSLFFFCPTTASAQVFSMLKAHWVSPWGIANSHSLLFLSFLGGFDACLGVLSLMSAQYWLLLGIFPIRTLLTLYLPGSWLEHEPTLDWIGVIHRYTCFTTRSGTLPDGGVHDVYIFFTKQLFNTS